MPRLTSYSVSLPRLNTPPAVSDTPQTMSDLPNGAKIVCGVRTHPAECSKLGKTRIIRDVKRGVIRNTGFYDQKNRRPL